jgi:ribosomal protein L7/L12
MTIPANFRAVYIPLGQTYVLMQDGFPVATGKTEKEAFINYFQETPHIEVDMELFTDAVKKAVLAHRKIDAIKQMRAAFGPHRLGLRQGKDMVETIMEIAEMAGVKEPKTLGDILEEALRK